MGLGTELRDSSVLESKLNYFPWVTPNNLPNFFKLHFIWSHYFRSQMVTGLDLSTVTVRKNTFRNTKLKYE